MEITKKCNFNKWWRILSFFGLLAQYLLLFTLDNRICKGKKMTQQILKALRLKGYEVIYVKGVFAFKDGLRLSTKQAHKMSGLKPIAIPRKQAIKQLAYGDYAWIAAINRIKE